MPSNERDWICGVANFGTWVTEDGKTFQPLCVIWMTADGLPICCEPAPPEQVRDKAVEIFYSAVRERAQPSRVRVRLSEIHLALCAGLPQDIDVELTGTPELDTLIDALGRQGFTQSATGDAPGAGTVFDVPPFYAVAAKLFDMRPWNWLTDEDVVTVSSPEISLPWGGVVISRNYHLNGPGLLLFTSRYDAGVFPRRKREGPPWNGDFPFHAGVTFCDVRRAPKFDPSSVRRLAEYGWDAPSPLMPVTVAFGPGRSPRPVTVAEYVGLAHVQFAFTAMFSDPAADARAVGDLYTCRVRMRLENATSLPVTVNLSVPLKALDRLLAHGSSRS